MSASGGGLRFECTQCGACCTNRGEYAYVYVEPDEVRVLAKLLGRSEGDFRSEYTFVDEYGWTQLAFRSDHCVFLRGNRCSVYAARPTQCRTFPFWRSLVSGGEWTPEAQELCEGVGRGRSYDPVEVEERMLAFELSDEE